MATPPTKQSGFDIDLGNQCSATAYNWAKRTFQNRDGKAGELSRDLEGGFSNLMIFGEQRLGIGSDGIGTKVELAERTKIYHTLGFDLLAMVVDDLIASGFVPTSVSNILDVDVLDHDTVDQLMRGLHDAANFCQVAVTGGEIAELGSRIGGWGDEGMHFNWCSTAIGVLHPSLEKPISGRTVKVGDKILAIKSRGFRSNGFSAIRRSMQAKFGDNWHEQSDEQTGKSWGETLLSPSLICAPAIVKCLDAGVVPKGIAHITGGGLADNLRRVLKHSGLGALMNDLFAPHHSMTQLQEWGELSNEQAYLYWNMGHAMIAILDNDQIEKAQSVLSDTDYETKVIGHIIAEKSIHLHVPDSTDVLTLNY